MRLNSDFSNNMCIIIVMVLIISLFFVVTFPYTLISKIFGIIFLIDIAFIVFGIPIIALWPSNQEQWEAIKRKFKKK